MTAQLGRLVLFTGIFVLICSAIFVVNQTAQVVALANTVSPVFGQVVLYGLLIVYALIVLVPIVMFVRLPQATQPPADDQSPEFRTYLKRLGARLATNPHLAGRDLQLNDRAGIEAALNVLDEQASRMIKATASTVFVSTAISQNGRLDALMVLIAQSRMVWQLAHLYYQRPSLPELIQLYANIGATAFLVSQIEDLDISEQVEPVIASALGGSLASAAPGMNMVATLVTQSILEGTANAFLTLRVGVIGQRYCASLTTFDRRAVRRYASVTAASMLGAIVSSSSMVVSKAILSAAKRAGVGTVGSVTGRIRTLGGRLNPFKKAARSR
ncbi:MAG TPA: DUF697 domain-containing protein [Anaerolineae bacterium]|nr:DUF697 domain-containing protein [Anaerolineae bacterium]